MKLFLPAQPLFSVKIKYPPGFGSKGSQSHSGIFPRAVAGDFRPHSEMFNELAGLEIEDVITP